MEYGCVYVLRRFNKMHQTLRKKHLCGPKLISMEAANPASVPQNFGSQLCQRLNYLLAASLFSEAAKAATSCFPPWPGSRRRHSPGLLALRGIQELSLLLHRVTRSKQVPTVSRSASCSLGFSCVQDPVLQRKGKSVVLGHTPSDH